MQTAASSYTKTAAGSATSAAVFAENTNAAGIAITGRVTSTDACAVLIQKGAGEILRAFSGSSGGNLVTQLFDDGGLRTTYIWAGAYGAAPPTVTVATYSFNTGTGDIAASADLMAKDDLVVGDDAVVGGDLYIHGDLRCSGNKAVIPTKNYGRRLVFVEESTGSFHFDRGTSQLGGGSVTIHLDPVFLQTVTIDEQHSPVIRLMPTADCRGIYVAKWTPTMLTVKEAEGGASSATFNWEIAAKRKGYENVRLPEDKISD